MKPEDVSVLVLTYNEQPNIERCLLRLKWASEVLVIDSGSNDETLTICTKFSNVRVVQRAFDSFASQCNFGLSLVKSEWVLSLDSDYVIPEHFPEECRLLSGNADGYSFRFRYLIYGRPLRSSLYPPRTVLYRVRKAKYEDIGHGHRVKIDGLTVSLAKTIDHDDRKPLDRWLGSQRRYAVREAEHLSAAPPASLGTADKIRKRMWLAAPGILIYVLIWKRCLLDGWPGIYYAFQRAFAELLLSLELLDRKLRKGPLSVAKYEETKLKFTVLRYHEDGSENA